MSTGLSTAQYPIRHPLGLPPGSVRGLLGLMIGGLFYVLLLLPEAREVPIPIFLYFLLGLILLFFAAHGNSIGSHLNAGRPLGMPHGVLRTLHLLGFAAAIGYIYYAHPERLTSRLTPDAEQIKQWPYLFTATAAGFSLGYVLGRGPWRDAPTWQDIVAWLSLLAMIGLAIETIIIVFINPSMLEGLDTRKLELGLTAIVAFYFGARC